VVIDRFLLVVVLVVVRRDVELDRSEADDLEIRAALGATQVIALVDVEFVDFDFGIAFRAGGHTCSDRLEFPLGGTIASIATPARMCNWPAPRSRRRRF